MVKARKGERYNNYDNSDDAGDIAKIEEGIEENLLGELIDGRVLVKVGMEELSRRGYGYREESSKNYYLYMYEALYLLYNNKMSVIKGDRELTFDELVDGALEYDATALTKFLVYRDLRSRGYVAREGFGFNDDFRVYERGEYGTKPARYIVTALNEGREIKIDNLSSMVEQISTMGKEPIIAVIERRGEVIYYKVGKMHFSDRGKVNT